MRILTPRSREFLEVLDHLISIRIRLDAHDRVLLRLCQWKGNVMVDTSNLEREIGELRASFNKLRDLVMALKDALGRVDVDAQSKVDAATAMIDETQQAMESLASPSESSGESTGGQ